MTTTTKCPNCGKEATISNKPPASYALEITTPCQWYHCPHCEADFAMEIEEGSRRTHAEQLLQKQSGTGRSTASHPTKKGAK